MCTIKRCRQTDVACEYQFGEHTVRVCQRHRDKLHSLKVARDRWQRRLRLAWTKLDKYDRQLRTIERQLGQ